jgi:RNA polymerase sigma-70 factor (ECF subfamily)
MDGASSHPASERATPLATPAEPVLLAVARGDRDGVARCIEQYAPMIWSMARRMSATTADAEDAVQEIFLDLWRYARRYDPTKGSEKVFVAVLARRRLIDRVRQTQRRLAVEEPLETGHLSQLSSSAPAEQDAEIAEARWLLEQLPALHQEAIALSLLGGLSHGEIALRLGWPLGTVKTVIRRGILRMKELMDARLPHPSKELEL